MKIDKFSMAKGWMMQDDASPEEAKATWDFLEKKFEDNRNNQLMASAETDAIIQSINDKFGPGTMFPASQAPQPEMTDTQAIFEWEERNRKAGGGRIGFEDGNDVDVPKWKRTTNYKKTQEAKKKGLVWNKYTKTMDKPVGPWGNTPKSEFSKLSNTEKFHRYVARKKAANPDWKRQQLPKKEGKVWDRKEKVFREKKARTKGKAGLEFEKKLLELIEQGNTNFETQGHLIEKITGSKNTSGNISRILDKHKDKFKFTRKTRLGGNEALKNEKILEYFNQQEPGSRINVERAVKDINKTLPKDQQLSETIIYNRLKDTKFNTNFLGSHTIGSLHGELSDGMKQNIIDTFGDELGITMEDFAKKGRYGVNAAKDINKYEAIRRFVKGGKFDVAYNVGAADGWILESYKRAGYKPLKEVIKGVEKTIGYEAPDGTKWYGAKKWATKYNGKQVKESNPGWKRVDDLVKIVGETRVAPNQAIMDLLSKGSGIKNINGITLESLTGYLLDNNVDVKDIKRGLINLPKHHVKGVKISPDADIQLVTRVANEKARDTLVEIENLKKQNLSINYDAIDADLKNYGVSVVVDGKRLGGQGFESKADIEKWATEKIGKWKKADFEKFAKQFKNPKLNKFAQNMMSSGPAGAYELLMKDPITQKLINSKPFKEFEALTRGTMRTAGKAFGLGDLVLGYYDYKNNLSKGESPNVARENAYQMMSFGLWKTGDKEVQKEIRERFVKEGGNPDIFDQTVALNKKHQEFRKTLNEFAEQSEWAGDKTAKATFEKMLTNNMNDIINMQKKLSVDYGIDQAGGPITIGTSQAAEDVKKAAYGYAKDRTASVIEKAALRKDPAAGVEGDPIMNMLGPGWWKKFLPQNLLWGNFAGVPVTEKEKEAYRIKQLAKEDPEAFEKHLQKQGVYRSEGMNLPALINFSMRYPEYGVNFETGKKSYFDGGIASLRRKK